MGLHIGTWIFLIDTAVTLWVILLGGAERLLRGNTLILLVDEEASSWSPKQIKLFVAASWFAYFMWWAQ